MKNELIEKNVLWGSQIEFEYRNFNITVLEGAFIDGKEIVEFRKFIATDGKRDFGMYYSPEKYSFKKMRKDFTEKLRNLV